MPIVLVIDTETTGLPKQKLIPNNLNYDNWPLCVQFSQLLFNTDSNNILAINDNIIRTPNGDEITQESSNIHHITNEISQRDGLPFISIINSFISNLKLADIIVAHNMDFDKNVIISELYRIVASTHDYQEKEYWQSIINEFVASNKFYCTMLKSTNLCNMQAVGKNNWRYTKFPKLSELNNYLFHSEPKNLHNSLIDILICFRCFYKLYFDIDIYEKNVLIKVLIDTLTLTLTN